MLATELALKGIPVRVNAIAPGVYESEMTLARIPDGQLVDQVGNGIQPIPAKRAGLSVVPSFMPSSLLLIIVQAPGDGGDRGVFSIRCWMLYEWPGDYHRWRLSLCQPFCEVKNHLPFSCMLSSWFRSFVIRTDSICKFA